MKKILKRVLVGCAFAALALPSSAVSVSAQTQENGDSPWVKICNVDPKVNKQVCFTSLELRTNTGQFLSSFGVKEIDGEARKLLIIAVPTGRLIQPGLGVQIDSGKLVQAKYSICVPTTCVAELVVDDGFIASMKQGNKITLTTFNQQAKAIPLEITLIGFTKVYEGEAMDVAELQKKQTELQDELKRRAEEARQKLIDAQKNAAQ
ncbi:invasion associated locus B family protein [uncultured Roseibium sp.]|uniref:invasion associated locus B family protein n=1 Tax=uncultured Roseibium sp. TaxID=1936171 RepID=UPI003216E74B